jgi:large subunit ribosomal protein L6
MSRIGRQPVAIPAGVEVLVDDKNFVTVKGPKGELQQQISKLIKIEQEDGVLTVSRSCDAKADRCQHGLARTLISNMVEGVTNGFTKKLELVGVGYKAEKNGKKLTLNLGYSHPVVMEDPSGITVDVPEPTKIVVSGTNKELVGNYAADIRAWRKPEPYKGKGVRYEGEKVRKKEGKSGVKGK